MRYQTVYAREEGSVAAPTAGLHFTPQLIVRLCEQGVEMLYVTLHVGLDTFKPVESESVEQHHIHTEFMQLTPEVAARLRAAKLAGLTTVPVVVREEMMVGTGFFPRTLHKI